MSVKRRPDSGAWEVYVHPPGAKPLRKSNRHWTRADALQFERQYLEAANQPMPMLEAALDKWLDEYLPELKDTGYYESKARALRPFLTNKAFTDLPDVVAGIKRSNRHLKPATVNRRLAILKRITKLAFEEWGWIDQPVHTKVKLQREVNERHTYLTRAEVERLRMNCRDPDAGDLVVFAAFTGLRRSEMFRVQARDVANDTLLLDTRTKTGKPRAVPLHPRALHIAKRMPLAITPALLQKEWTEARVEAGLPDVRWHDLRHTYASWRAQSGATLQVIKELMGHATIVTTMRYAHLIHDNLKSAVMKI
ncbi:MAG: site-specific integrase [Gammaproteobacteria bacterium]|nr:site-specific integrase [Gammaproteobacteria bacterium]